MAIQVGRANAVVLSTDTATTNIDVNVGFTPTAGQFICLVYWSGQSSSTDAVGSGHITMGYGFGVSTTSRRGWAGRAQDAVGTSDTAHTLYDDAILKTINIGADTIDGALDFGGSVTNGVRFTVDDQFSADVRFGVIVIDGLSDVGIFDITEPASTGNADHTGAGVDNADLFFFISGLFTAANSVGTGCSGAFGAAHADGQFTVGVNSRDARVVGDTDHYGYGGECISRMNVAGTPISRAAFVTSISDGVRVNWLEVNSGAITFCAALKGIEATVAEALTQTDTTTDIAVTGLGNTCLGGIVVSTCEAENTQDTAADHHHFSFGSFTSTTNRNAHATWDQNSVAQEAATAVEYDEVYANISAADAIQGLMDIKSLDSGGATFIMDDADPGQCFLGVVLFATPAAAGGTWPGWQSAAGWF